MTKGEMKRYCMQCWPNYQLDEGVQWPENGSLQFNTILQLICFVVDLGDIDDFVC